jgi:hypothetical protein
MSIRAIDWVLRSDVSPPSDKFVLIVLANYCNSFGLSYPSVSRVVSDTGYDRKTVLRALMRLKDKTVIQDSGKRLGRTKQVVVYRLSWAIEETDEIETVPKAELFIGSKQSQYGSKQSQYGSKQSQSALENRQEPLKEPIREEILKIDALQKLSEVVEIFKQDPRFDGLDVDAEVKRLKVWAKKKNMGVSKRLLRYWLDNAERNLEEDDDEELYHEEPYYSWAGWTEERRRALRELWPGVVEPPTRWDKVSADIKEQIDARVKEGWG